MTFLKNPLCCLYFLFSLVGGILPWVANYKFLVLYGPSFDIIKFIQLANINPAAQSLSADLFVGAGAVIIFIIIESKRLEMKNIWIVLLAAVTIAFACAAPLFLLLRELRLEEIKRTEGIKKTLS